MGGPRLLTKHILAPFSLGFTPKQVGAQGTKSFGRNYMAKAVFLGLILAKCEWAESQNEKLGYLKDRTSEPE